MAKFCFYKGENADVIAQLRDAAAFCWGKFEEKSAGSFRLLISAEDYTKSFCETENITGAIAGYVRHESENQLPRFLEGIAKDEWAIGDDWTGSFAAVAYSEANDETILCNDIIGHHALYYANIEEDLIGGTSLIVLSRTLKSEIDAVGVLQRITTPYCNYGRRTMFKDVFRLLPGERLKWSNADSGFQRDYDNSLCREVVETDVKTAARRVWDCLKNEIKIAIDDEEKQIGMAMSGGWDSRLILGGAAHKGSALQCFTYGNENHYESQVARRCATAVSASHECFPIEERYFPNRQQLEPLIRETESGNYMEWFGMIEKGRANGAKIPLLLGDLCESIDGRYMTAFSGRMTRVNSFFQNLVGKTENFEAATEESFKQWCAEKRNQIIKSLIANIRHLSPELAAKTTETQIAAEVEADLELSFARVRDNQPKFAAMYDELFIWLHRIRFLLGNQLTWLGAGFRPVSPGMSVRFLRLITTIHPRLRIRKRLFNAIMRLPDFDALARIPSAQIPFVPSRTPDLVRDVLWGARSGLDQVLIRRSLKSKNPNARQRVLRSLDYVKEYRRESSAENIRSWFSEKYIKSDAYLKTFEDRANLNAWTLINVDLLAPANVSIILDLCETTD